MKKSTNGFTIVELLIVIVVIAILATISIVAYNGISTRARNNIRIQELKQWQKSFELYKAQNGNYPTMANGGYCLGEGFPVGPGGLARCRNWNSTSQYSYIASDSESLMTALKTVGSLPSGDKTSVGGGTIGPYTVYSDTIIYLYAIIEGASVNDCPSGVIGSWTNGANTVECSIRLTK